MQAFNPVEFVAPEQLKPRLFQQISTDDLEQAEIIKQFGKWHRAPKADATSVTWGLFASCGHVFTLCQEEQGDVIYLWDLAPEEFKALWRKGGTELFHRIIDREKVESRDHTYPTIFKLLERNK